MADMKPRTRAVIFRVTQEEYNQLKAASSTGGWRSISDFARSQALSATGEPSLAHLEKKLDDVNTAFHQLTQALAKSKS
jgi:hypothetical protein